MQQKNKGRGCLIALAVVFGVPFVLGVIGLILTLFFMNNDNATEKLKELQAKTKRTTRPAIETKVVPTVEPTSTPVSEQYEIMLQREKEENEKKEQDEYLLSLQDRYEELMGNLRIVNDDIENLAFYYDKTTPEKYATGIHIYFGSANGELCRGFRICYIYKGKRELYFNRIVINADGEVSEIIVLDDGKDTERIKGGVIEKYDNSLDENFLKKVAKFVSAESVKVRFKGDGGRFDYEMSDDEKQAFRNVMEAYQMLSCDFVYDFERELSGYVETDDVE